MRARGRLERRVLGRVARRKGLPHGRDVLRRRGQVLVPGRTHVIEADVPGGLVADRETHRQIALHRQPHLEARHHQFPLGALNDPAQAGALRGSALDAAEGQGREHTLVRDALDKDVVGRGLAQRRVDDLSGVVDHLDGLGMGLEDGLRLGDVAQYLDEGIHGYAQLVQ